MSWLYNAAVGSLGAIMSFGGSGADTSRSTGNSETGESTSAVNISIHKGDDDCTYAMTANYEPYPVDRPNTILARSAAQRFYNTLNGWTQPLESREENTTKVVDEMPPNSEEKFRLQVERSIERSKLLNQARGLHLLPGTVSTNAESEGKMRPVDSGVGVKKDETVVLWYDGKVRESGRWRR